MYKILSLFVFLVTFNQAFPQNFSWIKKITSFENDNVKAILYDGSEYVYVTGYFNNNLITGGPVFLTPEGNNDQDMFLIKYHQSTGAFIWAAQANSYQANPSALAFDSHGNIVVSGNYSYNIKFGSNSLITQSGVKPFIAKYTPDGDLLWVKDFGPNTNVSRLNVRNLKIDTQDNIYFAGTFTGSYVHNNVSYDANAYADILMFKLDSGGNIKWIRQAGSQTSDDEVYGLALKGEDLYITGNFTGSTQLSPSVSLNSFNPNEGFLARFDTSGQAKWAIKTGIKNSITLSNVATGPGTDVYFAGDENGMLKISKYDNMGNSIWTKTSLGGSGQIEGIYVNDQGDVYVSGGYRNYTILDQALLWRACTCANNDEDMFIAKYDINGNYKWVNYGGGESSSDRGSSISGYGQNVFVCGFYQSNAIFQESINLTAGSNYQTEGFFAKINDLSVIASNPRYEQEKDLFLYPNPCKDKIYVSSSSVNFNNFSYKVINIEGNIVLKDEITSGKPEIEVLSLPSGLYTLIITSGDGKTLKRKVVIY